MLQKEKAISFETLNELRLEVREFIEESISNNIFVPFCDASISGFNPKFSKKLAEKGWVGMTIPKKYGGHDRTNLERYVVLEELLAHGSPVAAHWVADRQTAPLLLKFGTEQQKQKYIPSICKGELYFAIGLSEPNSGSDLGSLSMRAEDKGDYWLLNGSKTWSTGAHHAHYMLVLCRTTPKNPEKKHEGMSQIIVDLKSEGISIRPIYLMSGEHEFNEVFFENVKVSKDNLVGKEGQGWLQGMAELAYERSGPERFLSTYPLLEELVQQIKKEQIQFENKAALGKSLATLLTLRVMSQEVAIRLQNNLSPNHEASIVKDIGTIFEKDVIDLVRNNVAIVPSLQSENSLQKFIAQALLHAPGFTIRGGTTEILRTIIAKGV